MNKQTIVGLGVFAILLIVIPVTVFFINSTDTTSQDIRSLAAETAPTATPTVSCQAPPTVSNVAVTYPSCDSNNNCALDQAKCSWDAVTTGVTNYAVKITEVDSSTVIKNESVSSPTTEYVFPVTQGKTYECQVSALNACGATGPAGIATALCQIEGQLTTPTSTPAVTTTVAPTSPPAIGAPVTPTPIPPTAVIRACAYTCATDTDCQQGLVCVATSNGKSYCAKPEFSEICKQTPSESTCCMGPQPTIPPTGSTETSVVVGAGSILLLLLGGALFFL